MWMWCGRRIRTSAWAIVLIGSAASGRAANDETALFHPRCAMQDINAITVIDDHGVAGDVEPERLGQLGLLLLDARKVCYAGRVDEALASYDIILQLGPVRATSVR